MREIFTMWKDTRMIILVALTAAIYGAFLIVFKGGIPIVPGVTEVRPANVFPPVFGLLFGPAGAWGAAIGNTVGDIFGGTLDQGSILGAIGNFFLAFVPYKMWGATFGLVPKGDMSQRTNTLSKLIAFEIVALTGSAACAIIIAWYADSIGMVPFAFLSITITINNFAAACVVGPILLSLLYPRVKRWGLLWTDVMNVEDVAPGFAKSMGSLLMIVGAIGGLIVGLMIALGVADQAIYGFDGVQGNWTLFIAMIPFLAMLVIAGIMLSGREQFVEDSE
jgi:energy-coupling factor transport system substrate-specific component